MTGNPTPTPRFRWLKRLSIGAAVLVLLLVGLRVYWGIAMRAKVDRALAEVRAAGLPIDPDDLTYEALDPSENAATFLRQALSQWPTVPGSLDRIDNTDWYIEGPEAGHADPITDNAAYLASCEPVLDMIRQGVALQQVDWLGQPLPADQNAYQNLGLSYLGGQRQLARLMNDAAVRAFDADQPEHAIQIIHLIFEAGNKAMLNPQGLIDVLVGIGIHAIIHDTLQTQLPKLSEAQLRDPAIRRALVALQSAMLDDAPLKDRLQQAQRIDDWLTQRYIEQRADGSLQGSTYLGSSVYADLIINTPVANLALAPLMDYDKVFKLEMNLAWDKQIQASDSYREAINESIAGDAEAAYLERPWLYPITGELWFSSAGIQSIYRSMANGRMAATAIALRLYQADHQGERPATLDALVPGYLDAVPMDPFLGDQPIGYKPQGVVPKTWDEVNTGYTPLTEEERAQLAIRPYPLLYCVDHDLVDNGGFLLIDDFSGQLEYQSETINGEKDRWFLLVPEPEYIIRDDTDGSGF